MPTLPPHCPAELGSVSERDSALAQLHQLAVVGGPCWRLARVLKKGVQVDGENSLGQTGLFLSALLGRAGAVRLLLRFGADPNHRCLDGSTPVHAGAFSGHCQVFLWLLEAGGDLRLHDQQGWTAADWAQQAGPESWQVLELLRECRARMSLLAQGGETALASSLGELWGLRAGSLGNLHLALSSQLLPQAEGSLWPNRIQRSPQVPGLGFGQLSSLRPLGLTSGVPLVDPEELLPAQGEPDRTYECGAHTIMVNLLWRGHPVTVRKLKPAPARALPDLLLSDLKHCSLLHHPNLLLLMALSPSPDLAGLCLLFEPIQEGSLHRVLHCPGDAAGPRIPPGFPPGQLLLQVLEALLFLQGQARAHGGLSSHAVQLVRPGLAKVSNLEHGRSLPRPQEPSLGWARRPAGQGEAGVRGGSGSCSPGSPDLPSPGQGGPEGAAPRPEGQPAGRPLQAEGGLGSGACAQRSLCGHCGQPLLGAKDPTASSREGGRPLALPSTRGAAAGARSQGHQHAQTSVPQDGPQSQPVGDLEVPRERRGLGECLERPGLGLGKQPDPGQQPQPELPARNDLGGEEEAGQSGGARSFQECIDLAAQARRLDRQEGRTQVLVPELSKESPFTSLQKLDLLEEIITELQGAPKPRS
ncbi:inactive serine/threonine-protein kinase TEX14-like isoform 6-T8 [Sarcophilus harrisii]